MYVLAETDSSANSTQPYPYLYDRSEFFDKLLQHDERLQKSLFSGARFELVGQTLIICISASL